NHQLTSLNNQAAGLTAECVANRNNLNKRTCGSLSAERPVASVISSMAFDQVGGGDAAGAGQTSRQPIAAAGADAGGDQEADEVGSGEAKCCFFRRRRRAGKKAQEQQQQRAAAGKSRADQHLHAPLA
uniref:BZIP domain-containing protein n=1 Tax=Macrostomum lignano TaxID=282301 RepID=A0A1I8HEI7_9PLAT